MFDKLQLPEQWQKGGVHAERGPMTVAGNRRGRSPGMTLIM